MRWQFVFDKVSTRGDIKEKVASKFGALEKYLRTAGDDFRQGMVKLSRGERWGYKVKVDLKLPGRKVAVEGRGKELLSAVDEAYRKSARVVRKYYERLREKRGER